MDLSFARKCPAFDYSALVSGAWCSFARTLICFCMACYELVDVGMGKIYFDFDAHSGLAKYANKMDDNLWHLCNVFGKLVMWYAQERPFPKCRERLDKVPNCEIIAWV